jgi:hypothetical protein
MLPLVVAFSIGLMIDIPSALSDDSLAIVSIYNTSASSSSLGTGFFVSDDATIVTAFHVIEGARHLSVFDHSGQEYTDIFVQFMDPNSDIAVLQLDNSGWTPYFSFSTVMPGPSDSLRVIGNPRGIRNQVISARTTQSNLLDSLSISDGFGRPIFANSIGIIPLDLTLYSGMSGAPVLNAAGEAVGVLSGSFQEGGSYAWAIPIELVLNLFEASPVNLRVQEIEEWPTLSLMRPDWGGAVRSYRQNTNGRQALHSFYRELARLERHNQAVQSAAAAADWSVSIICSSVESALSIGRMTADSYRSLTGLSDIEQLNDSLRSMHFELMRAREDVRQTSQQLQRRWESEAQIRGAILHFSDWIDASDLSDLDYDYVEDAKEDIMIAYPELLHESFEVVHDIADDLAVSFLSNLSEMVELRFHSYDEAEHFLRMCKDAVDIVQTYHRIVFSAGSFGGSGLSDEIEMFARWSELMWEFQEYILYLPDN